MTDKNKQSTISKLINYFNDDEEEEEIEDEPEQDIKQKYQPQKLEFYEPKNNIDKFYDDEDSEYKNSLTNPTPIQIINNNIQQIPSINNCQNFNDIYKNDSLTEQEKQNQIFTTVNTNTEDTDDFFCENDFKKNYFNEKDDFNKLRFVSFQTNELNEIKEEDSTSKNVDEESENNNIEKQKKILENELLQKQEAMQKIIKQKEILDVQKNLENNFNVNKINNNYDYNKYTNDSNCEPTQISSTIETEKENFDIKEKEKQEQNLNYNFQNEMFGPEFLINSKNIDMLLADNENSTKNNYITNNNTYKKCLTNRNKKQNIKNNNTGNIHKQNTYTTYTYNNNRKKSPINFILYEDAKKRQQKFDNITKIKNRDIDINAKKTKITNKSYQIAINYIDKKIDAIINNHSSNNELSILDIAYIFYELKIFREIFKNKKINNLYEFKTEIISNLSKNEKRKNEEIIFLEQTWVLFAIENKSTINKDIFSGFIKIIYDSVGDIKQIVEILKTYLKTALIGFNSIYMNILQNENKSQNTISNNDSFCNPHYYSDDNDNNISSNIKLISPLFDNKVITNKDIWKLNLYVHNFNQLKKNILAYEPTNNYRKDSYEKILKEQKNKYTFEPNVKNNENKAKKKNFNFSNLYKTFLEKETAKKITLNKLREQRMQEELSELQSKPKINNTKKNNDNSFTKENIYDKLYNMDKTIRSKKNEKIISKEIEDENNLNNEIKSYKLNINSDLSRKRMEKSFENKEKPKGFDNYVRRNKKGILEHLKKKYLIEKIPCGENYYKIRSRNITPFNITDMRKRSVEKKLNNTMDNINDKEDENEYFSLEIKIPNGQIKTLKIHANDDAKKIANNFCKIYSIKDSIKQKLIKNIVEYQKIYIMKYKNSGENPEGDSSDNEKIPDENVVIKDDISMKENEEQNNIYNYNYVYYEENNNKS